MPIPVQCGACRKGMKLADHMGGKRVACPSCGAAIAVPEPDPEDIAMEAIGAPAFPPAPPAAPPATPAREAPAPAPAPVGRPPSSRAARAADPDAEPWYYAFLVFYAGLCMGLGFLQLALTLLMLYTHAEDKEPAFTTWNAGMSFGLLVGLLLVAAPILLAVDIGRNIRRMTRDMGWIARKP